MAQIQIRHRSLRLNVCMSEIVKILHVQTMVKYPEFQTEISIFQERKILFFCTRATHPKLQDRDLTAGSPLLGITCHKDLMGAFALSDITSTVDQVTTIPFLLEGDAVECYHSLTKVVQDNWFELMRVLGQRFDWISHEPVYVSRMLTSKESGFPRHADYVKEFRACVIKSKVNTSDLQMGYLVNSRFVEGLSNDAVRRQYIVEVRSKWRSGRAFGFDTVVETIAEAYMAADYKLEEVQNASRTAPDTMGPVVSRPLPMMVPPT